MSPFHERTGSHRSAIMDLCQTKYIVLSLLVVQNTVYVLLMRYSRTRPGTMYLSSTAVCCVEAIKMLTCFGILTFAYLFQHRNQDVDGGGEYSMVSMSDSGGAISSSDNGTTDDDDVERSSDMNKSQPLNSHESFLSYLGKQLRFDYRLAGIAGIFTIQNNLLFLALTNLEPAVFQVTYQLKVLATAYFSVVLLKKELSRRQIVALVLLALGVALVELDKTENATNSSHQVQRRWVGILAVLGACCTSGAACVWFEYIVKVGSTEDETSSTRNAAPSLWANQFQMSMFGLIIALIAAIVKDGHAILSGGFFQGYSNVVFLVVTIQGKIYDMSKFISFGCIHDIHLNTHCRHVSFCQHLVVWLCPPS